MTEWTRRMLAEADQVRMGAEPEGDSSPPALQLGERQAGRPTTPEQWARQISESWRRGLAAVLQTGRLLAEARRQLPHGEWGTMVEQRLPFGRRHADRLIAIGSDRRFRTCMSQLPADILTLYALTRLEDGEFETWAADGRLNPAMRSGEIVGHVKRERRAAREVELAERAGAESLAAGARRYAVLYADPPWEHTAWSHETGWDRNPANHYPTMPTAAIAGLEVPAAADAVLFLWALAEALPDGLEVMAAWGFAYRSQLIWDKGRIGLGHWVRMRHELLLIGTRGEVPAPAPGSQPESVIRAPRPPRSEEGGGHSAKPALFRDMIARLYPSTPKLELFCRGAPGAGWDGWGNECVSGDS